MRLWLSVTVLCLIGLAIGFSVTNFQMVEKERERETGKPAIGGEFSLTNQYGERVTPETYAGKWTLVFFGFSHCPDICPASLYTIAEVMDAVDKDGKKLTPLFISVDAGDNPEVLKDYVTIFHPTIQGLSGTPEEIKQATQSYKVYYAKVEQPESALGYTMDHSAFVFLMDDKGEYVAHFSHNEEAERMIERIRQAWKEKE